MRKLENEQLLNLQGGKFWGWSDWSCTSTVNNGLCWTNCVRKHFTLFIRDAYDYNSGPCEIVAREINQL
ncbi:hypothetical protein GCM10011340_21120 [Roseivirga thermotolerans]|uniref:Uncharacterized protein n=1 Tax=Roseivirga thermotolerans TaxID=1758176 RepID=A0ABQ3I893_9BACT|nr:hypothetical protein GCM10011340_21120 [Roseivirga thermotolerans]